MYLVPCTVRLEHKNKVLHIFLSPNLTKFNSTGRLIAPRYVRGEESPDNVEHRAT